MDVIRERGYRSTLGKHDFMRFGFKESQWAGPGILIPTHGPDGKPRHFAYRPDRPKERNGKASKYVNPRGERLSLDVHPRSRPYVGDPATPLFITEGVKKGDALVTHGFTAIALHGVWGFKGKNPDGGVTVLPDWDDVALNRRVATIIYDSDVMTKPSVRRAMERLAAHIARKGGKPRFVHLPANPDGSKVGVDDYLVAHGEATLRILIDEASDETLKPLPPEISWEDPPYPIIRPLDLHRGAAYAVLPLAFKQTIREKTERDGRIVTLDPPKIEWKSERHIIAYDGHERRLLGPLAQALGRAEDAHPDAAKRLGVTVEIELDAGEAARWSRDGVRAFLGGATPGLAAVLGRLTDVLEHFMDFAPVDDGARTFPSSASSRMVALWALGTYFLPAAQVVGYPLSNGPAGSGKTKMLKIIARTAFLGELLTGGSSHAAIKHLAKSGATLCFDDVENIQDKSFDPDKRSIILAGNSRGVSVVIMEPSATGKWAPRHFPVFCPKAFSSIRGFDPVLGSRAIVIPLVRTASAKAAREPDDLEGWPHARRQLVDDLWALGLLHLAEAAEIYRDTKPEALKGRELEPWRLVLTMARLVDRHAGTAHYDEMVAFALAKRSEAHDAGEMSDEVWLLRALVRLVVEDGLDTIAADDIATRIDRLAVEAGVREPGGGEHFMASSKVGKLLNKLRLKKRGKNHHGSRRLHALDREAIVERARAYGVFPEAGMDGADGVDEVDGVAGAGGLDGTAGTAGTGRTDGMDEATTAHRPTVEDGGRVDVDARYFEAVEDIFGARETGCR